jgi:serine/threonine-protein kinase
MASVSFNGSAPFARRSATCFSLARDLRLAGRIRQVALNRHEGDAKLSPNGQFLAYDSDESKRREVYVQTFPEHSGKWQVSTSGGTYPVWSRDGRELYFIGADRKMMAVAVGGSGKKFEASVPKPLFEVPVAGQFDVSKDGHFLIHVPQDAAASNVPITVIVNWQSALKK